MKTAQNLIDLKKSYDETLEGEFDRIAKVIDFYDPKWDKDNNIGMSVLSSHYYDTEKMLNANGFNIAPAIGYHGKDIDNIIAKNKHIVVQISW